MNESPFLILVNNVALLLAVGVLYDAFSLSTTRLSLSKKVITGLCVGLLGIGLMSMPLASVTGVIIDARSILLSVSGLFLGIVPTLIAVFMTVVFRLVEGGQGAFAGILIIITSAGAGLLYRSWRGKNSDVIPWLDLYLFGVAVHLVMLTCLLALPGAAVGQVLRDVALPVLLVYPAATVALGVLLSHQKMRRVAELALQKSQRESDLSRQHLEATLAAIPDLLFEMDTNGKYYTCHATDAADLVAPAEELIGKTVYEVMPFEAAQTVVDAIHEANHKGASHGYQLLLPLQKGDRQFELSVAKKTSDQLSDSNVRFIVLSRDITDRKKAEQELHIAATAFDSQEGMLITDGEFKILRVNHAFTRVTGYEPDEVIGKTPAVLRSGKHSHEFYQQIKRALETDRYWQGEVWNKRKNGEVYPQSLTITAVQAETGEITNFVGAFTDITQRKKNEEDIHKLAFYDPLTGLPNRRSLQERLDSALHSASRTEQLGAVLFIDLDNFKNLNDTQGHDMGDQLLIKVASRLDKCVRNADMVARLGGDEFVVILENLGGDECSAQNATREIVEKINVSLFHPFHIEEEYYHTSCSIGVTLFSSGDRTDEVMKRSDMAMYQAKSAGKNTYKLFDPDAHQTLFSQAALEVELRKALPLKQLELFYQVQCEKDDIIGAEGIVEVATP
ncbi:diguanylate cyclase [Neptuniibacter sp.]|uniref:diguanylate cyclase domain-containing protein n=1 Tax=Neptuniibacter sp. TaxID=1962643 RepID=UPI002639BA39|nr:diguanylate cyclase [Neptuniibacter sp.]MCP4597374.1 diguanylate cyclase [Neptuniibacter sp.]